MNYLAHIFLSGDERKVQVGNFIGDFVKGNKHTLFPESIQKGILLHRKIDEYTDTHPLFKELVKMLRPEFGKYSGIMADMYADYFLASSFSKYSNKSSLCRFAINFYFSSLLNYQYLPERVKGFIFHFIGSNRLMKYASIEGLHNSLNIMSVYKSSAIQPDKAIYFLIENEVEMRNYFTEFFPDIIEFSKSEISGTF